MPHDGTLHVSYLNRGFQLIPCLLVSRTSQGHMSSAASTQKFFAISRLGGMGKNSASFVSPWYTKE